MYNVLNVSTLGRDSLHEALSALGEQLRARNASAHLVVVGGSGLLAIDAVRRATRDVDVVALEEDGTLLPAEPLPEDLAAAAAIVARDLGLPRGWLNPGPTRLLEIGGLPTGFLARALRRDFGPALRVLFASRLDQIHLKVYAAVDRGEPRDLADLRDLDPTPDELGQAARWARTHNAPGAFDGQLAALLHQFGVEDEGRDA